MTFDDLHQLNNTILQQLDCRIKNKESFSLIRLGDLGLRYLYDYFFDEKDFTHVGLEHPDLAMPSDEIGRKLIEEMIENMKIADWIDHPDTYAGFFQNLYNWRSTLAKCSKIYERAGIINNPPNYCSSLQGYLSFVKEFDWSLYRVIENRRILFAAPGDYLGSLNSRKDLKLSRYRYYPLSLSSNHWDRYNNMQAFFKNFSLDDWDLVLTTGSLYGRTIVGRIKKLGGRAFDIGQATRFNPDTIFDRAVESIDNDTFYRLKRSL